MTFIIFYCVFSYFFVIGIAIDEKLPAWNVLFAPLVLPIMLGRFVSVVMNK